MGFNLIYFIFGWMVGWGRGFEIAFVAIGVRAWKKRKKKKKKSKPSSDALTLASWAATGGR
jgi:hypothetical protein